MLNLLWHPIGDVTEIPVSFSHGEVVVGERVGEEEGRSGEDGRIVG